MNQFIAFTKKELWESAATYRLYILPAVFVLLGILAPLTAMLLPMILDSAMMADAGFVITIPEPSAYDAWTQFFGNMSQMGILAAAIIFGGTMGSELSRGTITALLTKGMKRHVVILSKFTCAVLLWSTAYLLCLAVSYVYTAFYFEAVHIPHFVLVFGAPWLFGLFIIALCVFGGVLFESLFGGLGLSLGLFFVLTMLNFAPAVNRYNPASLASGTLDIIIGTRDAADFIPAVIICAVGIIAVIVGAIAVFNHKRL